MSWANMALCKDDPDPARWFRLPIGRPAIGADDPAVELRALCEACAVRKTCLAVAMDEEGTAPHGRYGFRGGVTAAERDTLYRTNKLPIQRMAK